MHVRSDSAASEHLFGFCWVVVVVGVGVGYLLCCYDCYDLILRVVASHRIVCGGE
jgi:hypothetical protein